MKPRDFVGNGTRYSQSKFSNNDFFTVTGVKIVFGLTERHFADLGKPDALLCNPLYPKAAPTKLYRAVRVQQWLKQNMARLNREKTHSPNAEQADRLYGTAQ